MNRETATPETIEHYLRPGIKDVIQRIGKEGDSSKCGNGDFWRWYKHINQDTERLFDLTNNEDYLYLINRHRTLYWSLNFFEHLTYQRTRLIEQQDTKNEKVVLGTRTETTNYTLGIDLDHCEGTDIHTPEVKKAVEDMGQFFCSELKKHQPKSIYSAYSGGGIYVYIHHKIWSDILNSRNRDQAIFILTFAFNLWIADKQEEFFRLHPEHVGKCKADALNNAKRVFKTIFSVHKRLPYAVIPLDTNFIKIDFDKAKLPLSDEVIETGKNWYIENDEENKLQYELAQYGEQSLAKYENKENNEPIEISKEVIDNIETFPPCIRAIIQSTSMPTGKTRAITLLVTFLGQAGWEQPQAKELFLKVAHNLNADTSNIFDSWFRKMKCPNCSTIKSKGKGFPDMCMVELNLCNPDTHCKKIRSPFRYVVEDTTTQPEKEINYREIAGDIKSKYPIITLRDNPDEMYYYDSGVYKYGADVKIREIAQTILGDESSKRIINEIIYYIQNDTFIDRADINKEKYIINVANGLYNLHTDTLEPHTSEYISTCQIPIMYNPAAECPEISNFLCEILRPRDIALLLQAFGYCLIPDYSIQKAFLWNGSGLNGKGTLGRLLIAFIGKDNKSSESLQALNTDKFSSSNLYGKLVNIDTDLTDKAVHEDTMFKKLTGGDMIPAERKFQNRFEFPNLARLFYGANDIPQHEKGGYAWARRWIIQDFPVKFEGGDEDKDLDTKLQTPSELSGLLNYSLKALKWLMETKAFFYDKNPEQVGSEYLLKSNSVIAFMNDCTTPSDDFVKTGELYQAYMEYAKIKKLKKIEPVNKFGRLMKEGGYTQNRPYINGVQIHCYEGFSLDIEKCVKLKNKSCTKKQPDLNENRGVYVHWYGKKDDLSQVSRAHFQISPIMTILDISMIGNVENDIYFNYLRECPTYSTYFKDWYEKYKSDDTNIISRDEKPVPDLNTPKQKEINNDIPLTDLSQQDRPSMQNIGHAVNEMFTEHYGTSRPSKEGFEEELRNIRVRFDLTEEVAKRYLTDAIKTRGW